MKRTTTTTHRYDAEGKLIETVIVEHVEDDTTPNVQPLVQPWVQPYPYPTQPWTTTYQGTSGGTVVGLQGTTQAIHLVRPDDDDGTAGVPAIA